MLTKICGLTNIIDARTAVDAGASALGFVMGGKVLPVEVEPRAQTVREIIKFLPPTVDTFVVTHLLDPADILALAEYVNSSGIQISEDIGQESAHVVRRGTSRKIIKTVVATAEDSAVKLAAYEPLCDYILLDSSFAGYVGGTGHVGDWAICRKLINQAGKPVYLAGGLSPDNVQEAIRVTSPGGVDVSTGVSTYSSEFLRKDRKCPDKIRQFISNARSMVKNGSISCSAV